METTQPKKRLPNKKHYAFAQLVASGESQLAAYQQVYQCQRSTAHANSSKLATKPVMAQLIATLTKGGTVIKELSRNRKRELLAEFVENGDEATLTRLAALRVDNDMTGDNAPQQHLHATLNLNELMREDSTRITQGWDEVIEADDT